jgi:hypothetical protein
VAYIYLLENGKPTLRLDKLLDVMTALDLQFELGPGSGRLSLSTDLPNNREESASEYDDAIATNLQLQPEPPHDFDFID